MVHFRNLALAIAGACLIMQPAHADDISADWPKVQLPPPPAVKEAATEAGKTALLLFDFTTQTCSQERRPRCAANVPALTKMLQQARARNMPVIYSVAVAGTGRKNILPQIAPRETDPVLSPLGPDKFINNNLEQTLHNLGVTTLILTGTAANTTVLHTASTAALLGFRVIVPLDGMASNDMFSEAYTAWHLANAARIMRNVSLTRADMIVWR